MITITMMKTTEEYQHVRELWEKEWGGSQMIVRNQSYDLMAHQTLIATMGTTFVGACNIAITGVYLEILALQACHKYAGIGTALLKEVETIGRTQGIREIHLITSNDNLNAIRFYQRRGFRFLTLYPNAIDEARKKKPTIPRIGNYQIPIHDEIEFYKILQ